MAKTVSAVARGTRQGGEKYYLLQGKTKTGKPKYYMARKPDGVAVEQMPEGYEFYESPERGLVSVRKVRHSNVSQKAVTRRSSSGTFTPE